MKYKEALEIVNGNINLIGKETNIGLIDEIVIYPTDENLKEEFKKICEKNDSPSLIRRILSYPNTEEGKGVWELVEKELKNFYKKS